MRIKKCATLCCMTSKELRVIRKSMELTQLEFADRIRVARNSVVRMENGQMIVTPPMALLIGYVAKDHDATHRQRSRGATEDKTAHSAKPGASGGRDRKASQVSPKRSR